MPYISKDNDRREKLRNGEPALIAGELNYQIFYLFKHHSKEHADGIYPDKKIIKKYIKAFLGKTPNYQRYNDMTGVLIRCKKEIERRLTLGVYVCPQDAFILTDIMNSYDDEIAKYEDTKIEQNGDVE